MTKFRIDWFRAETLGDFGELRRYFERVESQLDETSRLERYVIESQPKPKDWDTYQETIQQELDTHRYEFEETLPRILIYSLVTSLHTVVEYRLKGICNQVKKRKNLPISITKFQGNIVEKASNFLKAFNLPLLQDGEIQRLRDFILVRNCIVHNTGFVEGSHDENALRSLISSEACGLSLDWEKRIVVPKTYFLKSLDAFLDMFQRLFVALDFGSEIMVRVEDT